MRLLFFCLPLLAHAQIAGTVLDATNNSPLPGVKLTLNYATHAATTDATGRFLFQNLKPDNYYLTAEKDGYAKLATLYVRLAPGETITNFPVRLSPESSIAGRVLNSRGPAGVTLTPANSQITVAHKQTDPDGRFHLPALPPGNYKLYADNGAALSPRDAPTIQLAPGEHKTGIEVTLAAPRLVTVRGRFNGELPTGDRIFVFPEKTNGEFQPGVQGGQFDAERRFALQSAPGPIRLKVMQMTRPPIILGYLDVTVPDAGLDNVQINPSPIRNITAKFSWLNSSAPVPGEPEITLNPMERLSYTKGGKRDPDGVVTIPSVGPDRYSVLVFGRPPNAYVHSILAGGADISQTGLDLITGTATGLEIVFAADGATVVGKVVDAEGKPFPGASVSIFRTAQSRPVRESQSRLPVPNAQGHFSETAIAPGEYRITARANGKLTAPQDVKLTPNARLEVELKLP